MRAIFSKNLDLLLIVLVITISLFGCLMVYSSSSHSADQNRHDSLYYFKRQLLWLLIAFVGGGIAYLIGFKRLLHISPTLLAITAGLLILVLFLEPIRGVHLGISFGQINFQPSEMAKIALILFFASAIARVEDQINDLTSFIALAGVAGFICGLIIIEPDIGNTLALAVSLGFMLYIGGSRKRHLLALATLGIIVICVMVFGFGYEKDRIVGYLAGLQNPLEAPYQVRQGLIGVGNGGIIGTGWGGGGQKLLFLPVPYSDFIYAVIAEETGMILTLPLITVYLILFYLGCRIAEKCADLEAKLVVFGMSAILTASAFINIGVVLAVLPVTGLTLPFISYGGSSLLSNMIAVGIILSVAKDQDSFSNQEKAKLNGYNIRSRWYRRAHLPGVGYRQQALKGIARR